MKSFLDFLMLAAVKIVSQFMFRFRGERVDLLHQDGWSRVRLLVLLNHTSLYEPVLAGFAPYPLLWRFAYHGVPPVAEKTMRRNIGIFFRFLARNVVVVTRQRDETWDDLLNRIDCNAIVMILPEGRMMRRSGLDAAGKEMTVRGGVADIPLMRRGSSIPPHQASLSSSRNGDRSTWRDWSRARPRQPRSRP